MKAEGGRKWPDSVTVSRGGGRGGVGGPTFDVIQLAPNELEMVSHLQWNVALEGALLSRWLALFYFLD